MNGWEDDSEWSTGNNGRKSEQNLKCLNIMVLMNGKLGSLPIQEKAIGEFPTALFLAKA